MPPKPTIVLATDGSALSETAVAPVLQLAKSFGARVTFVRVTAPYVVTVVDGMAVPYPTEEDVERAIALDVGKQFARLEAKAEAELDSALLTAMRIIRQIALTGCRRGEIIGLRWAEADTEGSAFRFTDTKTGESIRPIGLPVVDFLEAIRPDEPGLHVFPGERQKDRPFGSFPKHWNKLVKGTALEGITAHVLRHSFASIANDLGFTEVTIAALLGHSKGTMTSKYIHTMDSALIMAADTVSSYIEALLNGVEFKQTIYAFDRTSRRRAALRFLAQQHEPEDSDAPESDASART